jgi:hypothetical protein
MWRVLDCSGAVAVDVLAEANGGGEPRRTLQGSDLNLLRIIDVAARVFTSLGRRSFDLAHNAYIARYWAIAANRGDRWSYRGVRGWARSLG